MNEIRDMEKQVTEQLRQNAEQSIQRADKIRASLESIESTAAITQLRYLRGHIDELGKRVIVFRKSDIEHAWDINETRANLTLAYRHLEDARMRLGKAIQAIDGGVSCYDK